MTDTLAGPNDLFRVLVLSAPEDPADFTPILMEQLGLNKIDARIQQHNFPGLIQQPVTKEVAEQICQQLHEIEGYGIFVPVDEVPSLAKPMTLHHVACRDGKLVIYDLQGDVSTTIPGKDLELLSIGALPTESSRREVDYEPPMHTSTGPKGSSLELPAMMGAEAYLIAEDPFRVYLINHNEMNYEYLGDRKSTSAAANFELLADDLIAMAPQLYLTPAARAFTNHGLLNHYQFDSKEALCSHTLFHLLICRQMHQ